MSYFQEAPSDFDKKDGFKDALFGRIEVEQSPERAKRSRRKEARSCTVSYARATMAEAMHGQHRRPCVASATTAQACNIMHGHASLLLLGSLGASFDLCSIL